MVKLCRAFRSEERERAMAESKNKPSSGEEALLDQARQVVEFQDAASQTEAMEQEDHEDLDKTRDEEDADADERKEETWDVTEGLANQDASTLEEERDEDSVDNVSAPEEPRPPQGDLNNNNSSSNILGEIRLLHEELLRSRAQPPPTSSSSDARLSCLESAVRGLARCQGESASALFRVGLFLVLALAARLAEMFAVERSAVPTRFW